jgi:hypothetical protein
MPAKSKAQQRFFGVVKGIQKGTGKGTGKAKKAARDMSASDVDDFASTKHKGLPNKIKRETRVRSLIKKMVRELMAEGFADFSQGTKKLKEFEKNRHENAEVLGWKLTGKPDIKVEIGKLTEFIMHIIKEGRLDEKAKRDYKAEYKKFQSSTKSKKYRAELNKYNRKKGTYGNGDKKDASHKGGKIAGFEKESVNRGRREKSRLKKEGKLNEDKYIAFYKSKKLEFNAKSLYDAKKYIIDKLKVPKRDYGIVSVMNKTAYDKQQFRFEGKLTEKSRLKQEQTVRLSLHKDANFVPGKFVQLMGKKGVVKLDKKSVKTLAKLIRNMGGKFGMGWSFTEGKLTEAKVVRLPNGVKVKIEFKGITFDPARPGSKPVFLDRDEMLKFFKATSKYLRYESKGGNGKLTEIKYDELFNESGILYHAGVKKYGKEGMKKIQQAAGKRKSHAAIGAIKDKYEKGKKDEGKLTEANKSLPPFEIAKRMMKSKYWNKAGKGFQEKVIRKFRGRGVTPKALDKWLPDYIDGKEISKLFEGKLNEYNRNYSELEKYETAIFDVIIQFKKIYERSEHKKNRKINKYIQELLKIEGKLGDEVTELE